MKDEDKILMLMKMRLSRYHISPAANRALLDGDLFSSHDNDSNRGKSLNLSLNRELLRSAINRAKRGP